MERVLYQLDKHGYTSANETVQLQIRQRRDRNYNWRTIGYRVAIVGKNVIQRRDFRNYAAALEYFESLISA